jgi:amino acid adenylation domain-containing protein
VHPTGTFIPFTKAQIEQSIPARFEQQVRAYPHRLAIQTRGQAITYAALNRAANRVAHAILAMRGTGNEPVALLFEQSVQALVALLGVLKAGKFYVPLDPAYPQARLAYVLHDAQTSVVVTNTRHVASARTCAAATVQVLNCDELAPDLAETNPGLEIAPDAFAYLMYTSGSTGQPKGVVDTHRNVLHHIMRVTNDFHVCAEDRQTLLRSYSFNGAVRDIFSALLNGAGLYPLPLEEEGVAHLAEWLLQDEITIYRSVISVFRQFAATLTGEEQFPNLRLIHTGGELVSTKDVELYKQHFSRGCIFASGLGITEVGHVRGYFSDHDSQIPGSLVPAGYPVEDIEVLIHDDTGQEVGPNGVGEIVVRSRYLAAGYWRRPELTQAAFAPDPAGGEARLYRTGDLGRLWPDGCLEHLGRRDFQVKIRGYRVEVAEIEEALLALDGVQAAIVVAREDVPEDKRLVAYIVPAGLPGPTVSALRRALATQLTDYMIPATFVLLDSMPLTTTGKIDRHALPVPGRARPHLDVAFVPPSTPVEAILTRIWAEILGLDEVGVHDAFLDLGGNSLLAAQISARVLDTLYVEIPIRILLEAPTVAHMALVITQHLASTAAPTDLAHLLAEVEGRQRL